MESESYSAPEWAIYRLHRKLFMDDKSKYHVLKLGWRGVLNGFVFFVWLEFCLIVWCGDFDVFPVKNLSSQLAHSKLT